MDSGFTLDQVTQKSEEIERHINNADKRIREFKKNWGDFEDNLRSLSRLSMTFRVEIKVLAELASAYENDVEAFFTDTNRERLDKLRKDFQEIIDLMKKIAARKDKYAQDKVDYDSSIQFRQKLAAELNELNIIYFTGDTYNTEQGNLDDNSINGESSLGSDY